MAQQREVVALSDRIVKRLYFMQRSNPNESVYTKQDVFISLEKGEIITDDLLNALNNRRIPFGKHIVHDIRLDSYGRKLWFRLRLP